MARTAQVAVFILLLCTFVPSLESQETTRTERTILATVIDEQGSIVKGLTAGNFRGKFRGKPVQINSVKFDSGPRRVVILLDASGSMVTSPKWALARALAQDRAR